MVKLRLTSLIVPETTAKESRVKLTLSGFTYNVLPDFAWITHLAQFFKAPPNVTFIVTTLQHLTLTDMLEQVFESVIPSEQTRITLKVLDGSVRVLAPAHSGALLLHFEEVDISTDIVGESQQNIFRLHVMSAYILFVDELAANVLQEPMAGISHSTGGLAHWKVCRSFSMTKSNLQISTGIRVCLTIGSIGHEHGVHG